MGVSQLLGARARAPPKVYAYGPWHFRSLPYIYFKPDYKIQE